MKKQQMLEQIQELKHCIEYCTFKTGNSMTFCSGLKTPEMKHHVSEYIKKGFTIWADTHITPRLEFLEKELRGKK